MALQKRNGHLSAVQTDVIRVNDLYRKGSIRPEDQSFRITASHLTAEQKPRTGQYRDSCHFSDQNTGSGVTSAHHLNPVSEHGAAQWTCQYTTGSGTYGIEEQ